MAKCNKRSGEDFQQTLVRFAKPYKLSLDKAKNKVLESEDSGKKIIKKILEHVRTRI